MLCFQKQISENLYLQIFPPGLPMIGPIALLKKLKWILENGILSTQIQLNSILNSTNKGFLQLPYQTIIVTVCPKNGAYPAKP